MGSRVGVFEAFKYAIYLLLAANVFFFFEQEWSAAGVRFATGVSGIDILSGFAATIDTGAWLVLLILFELETSWLRDRRLTRPMTLALHALTGLCYAFIFTSFWGYVTKVQMLAGFSPVTGDPCGLAGAGASLAVELDEYVPIDVANCQRLAGLPLVKLPTLAVYATYDGAAAQLRLAWVDVLNAAAWLGVVAVLAVDVALQRRDRLSGRPLWVSRFLKLVLYGTLAGAAVYWGFLGGFVDAWDAALWLVAFVFLELNLFDWNAETPEDDPRPAVSPAA